MVIKQIKSAAILKLGILDQVPEELADLSKAEEVVKFDNNKRGRSCCERRIELGTITKVLTNHVNSEPVLDFLQQVACSLYVNLGRLSC